MHISNVRLTLLRGIPPVDTADMGKNMNILCQRGKWDIFRILKRSSFLRLPLLCSFSCSHCCSQTLPSRALTVALNLSVLVLSLSLSSLSLCRLRRFLCVWRSSHCTGLCALRLSKRLVFYFVYVWKTCKGCCFKWLLMQKDVFFCLWNDLRVKFWFLFGFWWKMKSFWSFNCSVLDLKRFLRLGFDFCLLLK